MVMLGKIFKEFREARHVSLSQAAEQVYSKSMLSRFENGKNDIAISKLLAILENIMNLPSVFRPKARKTSKIC